MIHEPFDQSGQRLIVSLIDNSGPRPFGTSRTRQNFYTNCVGSYSHMLYAYHKIMSIINNTIYLFRYAHMHTVFYIPDKTQDLDYLCPLSLTSR